jgi:hypothetical protein
LPSSWCDQGVFHMTGEKQDADHWELVLQSTFYQPFPTGISKKWYGIATGYGINGRSSIPRRGKISFSSAQRLGPTQLHTERVPGTFDQV